tara:strand:+ start:63 stop:395 length:333 start_codon:yes stop_codon:yes gene_type:complete
MTQLDKNNSPNDLANCNLVLMACLFAISASLGTIGSLITSVGYGLYYKYWKPTLFIIPIFLFLMVIIIILSTSGFMTEENALGYGWLLGVIPSLISFLIFRDRVLTLRRR